MATDVIIPKLGFSVNEARLAGWLIEDGTRVEEGAPLYELESDKSLQEVESPATGTLRILKSVDETYEVGTVIGVIE